MCIPLVDHLVTKWQACLCNRKRFSLLRHYQSIN